MSPRRLAQAAEVGFSWHGLRLEGTLHVPTGNQPAPIVVMMQGSGPMNRDNDGYFTDIRRAFLRTGMATYSFDKPGCGSSSGDWHDHALEARADQVVAAIAMVQSDPSIDGARYGVWGHSQGGWMAQILGARDLDLAFAIAGSGPSIGVAAQDRYAIEHGLRAAGHDEAGVDEALGVLAHIQRGAFEDLDFDTLVDTALAPARGRPWFDLVAITDPADWALTKRFLHEDYRPADALQNMQCPFLAIYGGHDALLPAWDCSVASGRALAHAPTSDSTIVVYPNGDHRLRLPTGAFVDGYLDLLSTWSAERFGLG